MAVHEIKDLDFEKMQDLGWAIERAHEDHCRFIMAGGINPGLCDCEQPTVLTVKEEIDERIS